MSGGLPFLPAFTFRVKILLPPRAAHLLWQQTPGSAACPPEPFLSFLGSQLVDADPPQSSGHGSVASPMTLVPPGPTEPSLSFTRASACASGSGASAQSFCGQNGNSHTNNHRLLIAFYLSVTLQSI